VKSVANSGFYTSVFSVSSVAKKIRANPCASVVKFSLFFPQKYVIILTLYSGSAGVNVCLPAPGGKNAKDKPLILNMGYLDFEIVSEVLIWATFI